MTENEKYLEEAQQKVAAFKAEMESDRLRESAMALENVILAKEHDADIRKRLRTDSLNLWLTLIQLLDENIDPKFDPNDGPEELVQPPPTSEGLVYPPGADPALIDDPKARAEYEKAIADSRAKTENYRLQIQIGRLNDYIPPRAENFILNSFNKSAEDQKELKTAIDEIIKKPERKARLLQLLEPSETPNH